MMNFDLIVVGAGAAGLMAAGQAARYGISVLMLDKNERVGRKIMITGKGRCNVTNSCDIDRLMTAVRRNPRFLYSAFDALSPQDVMDFFEEQGVPLKVERGQRVFPVSDKAVDIVDALHDFAIGSGAKFRRNRVMGITELPEGGFIVKTADDSEFKAKTVLIATGGLSYPGTGSTGDGYKLAESFGHSIVTPLPSLVPIEIKEKWCADLMGLSLKNVTLTVLKGKKKIYSELGELMFTHFGISGPLVLSASSYLDGPLDGFSLEIDMKPGLSHEQLDARVLRDFSAVQNKAIKNSLDRLLPRSIIPYVIAQSEIDPDKAVNSVTREERRALVETIKAFKLSPKQLRPVAEAVVTRGGVKTSEINPKTMESKRVKGLYFAGEVMDLDGVTGGFNLQIAFSTGYVAGICAAEAVLYENTF